MANALPPPSVGDGDTVFLRDSGTALVLQALAEDFVVAHATPQSLGGLAPTAVANWFRARFDGDAPITLRAPALAKLLRDASALEPELLVRLLVDASPEGFQLSLVGATPQHANLVDEAASALLDRGVLTTSAADSYLTFPMFARTAVLLAQSRVALAQLRIPVTSEENAASPDQSTGTEAVAPPPPAHVQTHMDIVAAVPAVGDGGDAGHVFLDTARRCLEDIDSTLRAACLATATGSDTYVLAPPTRHLYLVCPPVAAAQTPAHAAFINADIRRTMRTSNLRAVVTPVFPVADQCALADVLDTLCSAPHDATHGAPPQRFFVVLGLSSEAVRFATLGAALSSSLHHHAYGVASAPSAPAPPQTKAERRGKEKAAVAPDSPIPVVQFSAQPVSAVPSSRSFADVCDGWFDRFFTEWEVPEEETEVSPLSFDVSLPVAVVTPTDALHPDDLATLRRSFPGCERVDTIGLLATLATLMARRCRTPIHAHAAVATPVEDPHCLGSVEDAALEFARLCGPLAAAAPFRQHCSQLEALLASPEESVCDDGSV